MKKRTLWLAAGILVLSISGCGQGTAEEMKTPETVESRVETEAEIEIETETEAPEEYYEDNFAVPQEEAASFARQIKEAVAEKDLEGLAALTAFPVYVGLPEAGAVKTQEDFLALGADAIFTDDLVEGIAQAEETDLPPSMAGFTLSGEFGSPNIIFGIRDGKLAISGINYP